MNSKTANSKYDLVTEIENRWSPRSFSSETISDEEMMKLFDAARWAASSNNYQPWRFMWARKGTETWDKIFNCLSDFNQKWVNNATILILTAYKEQFDNGKENFHALHDLGLAVGNMSIQAQSQGIALHQMAGVDWKKAHEVFEIPDGYHITTAIAVGLYGGDPSVLPEDLAETETKERSRKDLSQIVKENTFSFL
ncbi:nitroreductase family protein [Portibacter marinus]|uniref:nitroreductase family protein n=1 Tax=Portibacter marinus TaxID=2898660 RepID=UPI001F466640|nr:nitroreductase family protein [Portibacter marinus]